MTERTRVAVAALIVVLVGLPIFLLRVNAAAGLMVDDAYYVLMAKTLAEGQGYRLVSSATTAMVPLYPPAFPAILSIVFLFSPEFPANVFLLKSVSIAAMFGVGLLTYAYMRRRDVPKELAVCAGVAVTMTPAFVFLATSTVMSECVFTLSQLAAVVLIHRSVEADARGRARVFTVGAALMAAANVLIRSAGLAVVLAIGLWLLKERLWKRAVLFGAVVTVAILPWMLYARAHAPTPADKLLHSGSIVYSYGEQIWMRWAGDPASGTVTLSDFPARVGVNVVDVFARGAGGIFLPELLRGPAESGEEMVALGGAAGLSQGSMGGVTATMVISLALSAIVFIGYVRTARAGVTVAELLVPIALGIVFLWPFWAFRFIVPLTPYLYLYLIAGLRTLAPARVAPLALLCVIGLHVSDHIRYIADAGHPERSEEVSWLMQARETDEVLDWVDRYGGDGFIATTNPGLVYLRTGHRTVSFDRPPADWNAFRARGIRYVVCLVALEVPSSAVQDNKVRYQSASGFWIIEL